MFFEVTDQPEDRRNEPLAEVKSDLANLGRQLNALASARPLWSTTLNAQLKASLDSILSQKWRATFPHDAFRELNEQLAASFAAIDTRYLQASLKAALESPGLAEALRLTISPSFKSITSASTYSSPDPPKAAYTPLMTSPGAYFAKDEANISSFDELNGSISKLISKTPDLQLVWRGHQNADWGIHSALFRRLMSANGVKKPKDKPKSTQPYPNEDQMVAAEQEILCTARNDWRFDGLSALETFARLQHAGGPTRLIDVTKNPFIGAWFAVEQSEQEDSADGRLIAFATTPVMAGKDTPSPRTQIELDAEWGDRMPPWHQWGNATARQSVEWGTGACRRLWVPPAYDPRISAQNAAFLLDGVPITTSKTRSYFKSSANGEPATYWSRADLLASGSIYVKTFNPNRKPQSNKHNLAPTFTFRISAAAKAEIRDFLVKRFGYTLSYIYPDMTALADFARKMDLPPLGE